MQTPSLIGRVGVAARGLAFHWLRTKGVDVGMQHCQSRPYNCNADEYLKCWPNFLGSGRFLISENLAHLRLNVKKWFGFSLLHKHYNNTTSNNVAFRIRTSDSSATTSDSSSGWNKAGWTETAIANKYMAVSFQFLPDQVRSFEANNQSALFCYIHVSKLYEEVERQIRQ